MFEAKIIRFHQERSRARIGFSVTCHLSLVRTVSVHHPDLECAGSNKVRLQQSEVIRLFLLGLRVIARKTIFDPSRE